MASFLPVNDSPTSHNIVSGNPTGPLTSRPTSQIGKVTGRSTRDETPHSAHDASESSPNIAASHRKAASVGDEVMRGESDGERDGSDNETDSAGGTAPPSKKKKGQRFFCTEFPPCNLSFTRSEHLARHIRKHTGERPFQCHCSRRFSRLDNLRQHAQTVHVNEDIPGDSLAATGTRFQRQIRTERMRPQGRPRSGTAGSGGPHSRGHGRNLSTSSIASTTSTFSQVPELRRRPPPLIMAGDTTARARMAVDPYGEPPRTPPGQVHPVPTQSAVSGSPYAPSTMDPAGGGSPHFAPPITHAYGFWEGKTAARRLSVPSGTNPFLPPQHAGPYPMSYAGSAVPSAFGGSGGVYASPTSSNYSPSRDEGGLSAAEAEMRRRTWHPSTYSAYSRPGTSGLSHYQTPDTIQPSFEPTGPADQSTRLPGIESFDKVISQQRPLTPPHRKPSPMQVDSQPGPPGPAAVLTPYPPAVRPPPPISGPGHRRGNISWDMSLHRNLTGLEIRDRTPMRDAAQWGQQTIAELQGVASRPSSSHPHATSHAYYPAPQNIGNSHPQPVTRTSPEDSSSSEGVHTPSTAPLEYHPAIVHSNGYIEPHHPPLPGESQQTGCAPLAPQSGSYHAQSGSGQRPHFYTPSSREPGMDRLEALVAVATNENKEATKFFV